MTKDPVAAVQRINARWIVHGGLDRDAAAYLAHLASADPERLMHSCRRACQMMEEAGATEDPKPWFYAGLFSLAAPEEIEGYVAHHRLCHAAISPGMLPLPMEMKPATVELLHRLRRGLARLP